MTTAPYTAEVAALRGRDHGQVLRAVAYGGNLDASIDLTVRSARVTFDEFTAPRVTADLEAAGDTLEELAELARLDPRAGVRVAIEAGYVLDDGTEDVAEFVDLGLRRVTVNRPDVAVTLTLASDEARVIDASAAVAATITGPSHTAAIAGLIRQALSPPPAINTAGADTPGPAVTVDPVTDRWATIADLADRQNLRVYDAGLRVWKIETPPRLTEPAVTLQGGPGGTLTATSSSTDRDVWANYVTLIYRWRTAADVDKEVRATAMTTTGPYRITGDAGKKIFVHNRDVPTTQAEANAAALAVLARSVTRSAAQSVTAVAAWWLRPGMTARVTDVAGTTDRIVSRVEFRYPDRLMTVASRLPDPGDEAGVATAASTTTPPPVIPSDPPPPRVVDPPAEDDTKQVYTSSWKASGFATYRGNGVKRTDSGADHDVLFGNSGTGVNGNQSGILLFAAANSTGDETGKTIPQALTGATVQWVRLRAFASWFWSYNGGTARLGVIAAATLPATYTGARPFKSVPDWRRNTTRTVDLTTSAVKSALANGSPLGVTVGPGGSNAQEWYGKLSADGANTPTLTIRYVK